MIKFEKHLSQISKSLVFKKKPILIITEKNMLLIVNYKL